MSQFFSLPCGFVSKGPVPAQSASFVPDGSYPILKYPAGVIVPTWISRPDHINSANGADRVQLQADGNIYKPVPASASGNIKGGALGLFWASSISYKLNLPK